MRSDNAANVDRVWELMKKIGLRCWSPVMAAAVVTGTRPDLGDNRKVAM
jgi:hypothetical protein